MNPPNDALNYLHKIMQITEMQIVSLANYVDTLTNRNARADIIEAEALRLAEMMANHEQLQTHFAELLNYLQDTENFVRECKDNLERALFRVKHLEMINKDVNYWKGRAEYLDATRKLIFNELQQMKHGKENQQPG